MCAELGEHLRLDLRRVGVVGDPPADEQFDRDRRAARYVGRQVADRLARTELAKLVESFA